MAHNRLTRCNLSFLNLIIQYPNYSCALQNGKTHEAAKKVLLEINESKQKMAERPNLIANSQGIKQQQSIEVMTW